MSSVGAARPRIAFNDLVEAYLNDAGATSWDMQKPALLQAAASGLLASIEGPNEINNYATGNGSHGVNDTADKTQAWAGADGNFAAWAHAIHDFKTSETALAAVEVYAPTIATGLHSDYESLPNISDLVDFGSVHYYAGNGLQPGLGFTSDNPEVGYFANIYHWAQAAVAPTRPVVMTEYGAATPPGYFYTERAQAAYILNQMHDAAGIGAARFFIYTLVDPNTGISDVEGNFGLVHSDLSEKPIVGALAAFKNYFAPGGNFATTSGNGQTGYTGCGLAVTGITVRSRVSDAVVYTRADGAAVITVTSEPAVTDNAGHDTPPTPDTAHIELGSTEQWQLFDPLGANPQAPVAQGTSASLDVALAGYPKVIVIAPR